MRDDILDLQFARTAQTAHIISTVNLAITNTNCLHGNVLLCHREINTYCPVKSAISLVIPRFACDNTATISTPLVQKLGWIEACQGVWHLNIDDVILSVTISYDNKRNTQR